MSSTNSMQSGHNSNRRCKVGGRSLGVAVYYAIEEMKLIVSRCIHVPGELGNDYERESST